MSTKYLLIFIISVLLNIKTAQSQEYFQQTLDIYQPKLPKESDFGKIKIDLENNLKKSYVHCVASSKLNPLHTDNMIPVNVLVFDDRIEFSFKKKNYQTFYFKDLADYGMTSRFVPFTIVNGVLGAMHKTEKLETKVGNEETFYIYSERFNTVIADNLFYIKYHIVEEKIQTWLFDFKPIAEKYKSLTEKPLISEEQREYIVQANLFTQQKKYNKAIELYQKVYQINPFAFPAAYSNLALLFANLSDYQSAIYYMKLYLMLEPEAPDSRASQDKIYEWKAMMEQ